MERILFFVNEIPIDSIVQEIEKDTKLTILSKRSREIHLSVNGNVQNKGDREYIITFSRSMSETLLKLRKKYFNIVIVDERSKDKSSGRADFEKFLIPFLTKIEKEPNVDKRYSFSRIIVLLNKNQHLPELAFELGKLQIGAYVTEPFSQGALFDLLDSFLHRARRKGKLAFCLAGGGVEGLLYELGVLRALNSLFKNMKVTDFDIFCGISAGAYISAILANGQQPEEFIKSFEGESELFDSITAQTIYDLNFPGYFTSMVSFWTNLAKAANSSSNIFSSIIKSFPNGICRGENLRIFLKNQLSKYNLTDDFRKLQKELYIGATDLDRFTHVVFGDEGHRDVPISTAVRASSAMEPIYTPAQIGNNWYIDGAFTRTTNYELAIKQGAKFIIIIDPLLPLKTEKPGYVVSKGGIFSTIQGVKGLVSTRFERGYAFAKKQYPDVDFYVFKPRGEDMKLMSGSPMKYNIRLSIVAMAYETTVRRIMDDYEIFSKGFMKHGIELTKQTVKDEDEAMKSGNLNMIKAILENSPDYVNAPNTSNFPLDETIKSFHLKNFE